MTVRRVLALAGKELFQGPKNLLFMMAIVMPLALSLLLNLLFGSVFSGEPVLGIVDQGDSRLPDLVSALGSLQVRSYPDAVTLRSEVARGVVDVGLVLPSDFDRRLQTQQHIELEGYTWGQSQLDHQMLLATAVIANVREIAGGDPPIEVISRPVGEGESVPWQERLTPLIVLVGILLGGVLIPSSSLVQEKVDRTLAALTVTPVSVAEVLIAKGLIGVLVSMGMGLITLAINSAFGENSLLLVGALFLGALFSTTIGVLLGVLVKDINTLFATMKSMGIFLYAPALVYLFPQIPAWVAKVFPTYYVIAPVVDISSGAGTGQVMVNLLILAALSALMIAIIARSSVRLEAVSA